jgi:hypothetical protein
VNPNLERELRNARIHELAKREAERLRREAFAAAFATLAGWLRALLPGRRAPQWRRHAAPTGAR